MKLSLLLLLLLAPVTAQREYFQYQRQMKELPASGGQACLALDPAIFAHASDGLGDLRIFHDGAETPYVLRIDRSPAGGRKSFEALNKGVRNGQTSFDADLSGSSYSDVELQISAVNFIATVMVSGGRDAQDAHPIEFGSYTIFDLGNQKLGRSTVLHLPASNLPYLHFRIHGPIQPGQVDSVAADYTTGRAPVYVTVAQTVQTRREGRATLAEFTLPAHLPVDRVTFDVGSEPAQFSRSVSVEEKPLQPAAERGHEQGSATAGVVQRIHGQQQGRRIDEEQLAVDAPGGSLDGPARWTVRIDNGDDRPLAVRAVRLQMLKRSLCFSAAAGVAYTLYYGDAALAAPRYDFPSIFSEQAGVAEVRTASEQANPLYRARPDLRPFTEKHPVLLWMALVAVVALLGLVALRSGPVRGKTE